jgi:hypothetical protein
MPKCISVCRKKTLTDCGVHTKCSYVNGTTRKYCRLTSKYKMSKPRCNIVKRMTKKQAAIHIQQFVKNRTAKKKALQLDASNKIVQGRKIAKFMKNINPNKRRAYFLKSVCSDSGVCIAFGKENDKIKKHFDNFSNFKYFKNKRRIGNPSANGFVDLITYENEGYISNAVLKSSAKKDGDNLYYEFLVGQFINKQSFRFSCFVETYDAYHYVSFDTWSDNLGDPTSFDLNTGINKSDTTKTLFKWSCEESNYMAILIQSIKEATALKDKITSSLFIKQELLYALFQVYFPLMCLTDVFTHYDLHTDNVLIYEPIKGSFIHYHYHLVNGTVISFKSKYIAKIIDYGRSFFNDVENTTITGSSLKIHKKICTIKECNPNCGNDVGYEWLQAYRQNPADDYYISSITVNHSHDLRLIVIIKKFLLTMPKSTDKNVLNLQKLMKKLKYVDRLGTPSNKNPNDKNGIYNSTGVCVALQEIIVMPDVEASNETVYAGMNKIGDLHMYMDGRPISFIPV